MASPPLNVHHPTTKTPLLWGNIDRASILPLTSEKFSALGNPPAGGFVNIQAMTAATYVGQTTQTWNSYGTNTSRRPPAWSLDPDWRHHRRTPQSLSIPSPAKGGHKKYLLLMIVLSFIVCVLLSIAICGLGFGVYSLGMWLLGALKNAVKDAVHFVEAVWIVVRDIVMEWIEGLRRFSRVSMV